MDLFDALFLARLQFAFTISFNIVFPVFSIGLASYLAVLDGLWLWTGRSVYLDLFNYWKKIFAVAFGMGVVSGLVMSYQFGTNWRVFSDKFVPADWWKVIFNPSFPYRLVHMVLAAYLTTALVVGAIGAFHLLRYSGEA